MQSVVQITRWSEPPPYKYSMQMGLNQGSHIVIHRLLSFRDHFQNTIGIHHYHWPLWRISVIHCDALFLTAFGFRNGQSYWLILWSQYHQSSDNIMIPISSTISHHYDPNIINLLRFSAPSGFLRRSNHRTHVLITDWREASPRFVGGRKHVFRPTTIDHSQ